MQRKQSRKRDVRDAIKRLEPVRDIYGGSGWMERLCVARIAEKE